MKEKILKWWKIFLISILWIFILLEGYHIFVDTYNFKQLEKAKPILESIPLDAKTFYSLEEFNDEYNAEIKPIKDCYFVSNYNWNEDYIFGFKIHSLLYMYIYWKNIYSYPRYDISVYNICTWWLLWTDHWCQDINQTQFENIIWNSCNKRTINIYRN